MSQTPHRVLTGRAVKAEMARRGMSLVEVAKASGIPSAELHDLVAGKVAFDVDQLACVARILGVRGSILLGPDTEEM